MMKQAGLADRAKLREWANTNASKSEFPRLVRRLILETTPGLESLGMPAGEGVAVGGWDGTVRSDAKTAWVPAGLSVWELSTEKAVGTKADDDYNKRLDTPDGSPTSKVSYVAAILRPWKARSTWETARSAEKRWKSVRALGLDEIDAWLETAPVTLAWFSEALGLSPHGLRSAEGWWDAWASRTSPHLTADIVLAGRSNQVNAFLQEAAKPGITTLAGASLEEARAFIAAVGMRQDAEGDGRLLSRTAFVDEISAWRRLMLESKTPLLLVPLVEGLADEVPSGTVHHVVVPVSPSARVDLALEPVDSAAVKEALVAAGMDDDRTTESIARLARRSLVAFRRRIAAKPALHMPPWAKPPTGRTAKAALLACGWSEKSEADQALLAELAGCDYEEFREQLAVLSQTDDPLVQQLGSSWHLVSPYDAWLLLRESLTKDDLERLKRAVDLVLGEDDPSLDLAPDERWTANLNGKERSYSADLRRGISKALALLGTHGDFEVQPGGSTGSAWAHSMVRALLKPANADHTGRIWASIASELPLLGEASPQAVLDAVRTGLSEHPPVLRHLFDGAEGTGIFGSTSRQHHLLWALETIAWSKPHYGAAVELVAQLDALDPGGKDGNHPIGTLAAWFCPWHPEGGADAAGRLAALDGLRKRHGATAWKVLVSMLPEMHSTHFPSAEPKYRDWRESTAVTRQAYLAEIHEVVARAVEDAGLDPVRWQALIKRTDDMPSDDRRVVVEALEAHAGKDGFDADGRALVWDTLCEMVRRHRAHAGAEWALPASDVDEIDLLSASFAPSDPYNVHRWLFIDHMPDLDGVSIVEDHDGWERAVQTTRQDAIKAIDSHGGLDAVRRMASEAEVRGTVGWSLALATGEKYDLELLDLIGAKDPGDSDLTSSYYTRRFQDAGWPWLTDLMAASSGLSAAQRGLLLVLTRDYPRAWEVADELGTEVADEFWKNFGAWGVGRDFALVDVVGTRLLGVGRNAAGVDFLNLYLRDDNSDAPELAVLAAQGLDALAQSNEDAELRLLSGWDFERLFRAMERHRSTVGEDRVARLEWMFLPALGFEPEVPTLHRQMATSPGFFVEVLSTVYGTDTDEKVSEEEAEQRSARAMNGYRLLDTWDEIPGLDGGVIDLEVLREWVRDVSALVDDEHRTGTALRILGQALVSAPPDADEVWPPLAVREFLEEVKGDRVHQGFSLRMYNQRGVTSRGVEDGGKQERDLVREYTDRASKFNDRWPRTAAIFRELAESYEDEARRNDTDSERFRRGLEW